MKVKEVLPVWEIQAGAVDTSLIQFFLCFIHLYLIWKFSNVYANYCTGSSLASSQLIWAYTYGVTYMGTQVYVYLPARALGLLRNTCIKRRRIAVYNQLYPAYAAEAITQLEILWKWEASNLSSWGSTG